MSFTMRVAWNTFSYRGNHNINILALFHEEGHLCLDKLLISSSVERQEIGELDELCRIVVVPQLFHDMWVDSLVVHQRGADSKANGTPEASQKGLEFEGWTFTA